MYTPRITVENVEKAQYFYRGTVKKIVDGDTYDVSIDAGFGIFADHRIRLANIDTPETFRPRNQAEHEHGLKAREFVKAQFEKRKNEIYLRTYRMGVYGRYEADIYFMDNGQLISLQALLLENGFTKRGSYDTV